MKEKKFDKSKLLTAAVVCILIFFFVGGFLLGLDRVRAMEGTFPPNELEESLTPAPKTSAEAVDYLSAVLDKALNGVPRIEYEAYFSTDSDSLITDGSEYLKKTLLFAMDNFISYISSVEEDESALTSVGFGEDVRALLVLPDITADDVVSFTCNYIYYSCPSCGETSEEPLAFCEECGSPRAYFMKYRDEYDIQLVLKNDGQAANSVLERNFKPRTQAQIAALTERAVDGAATVSVTDVTYDTLAIHAKVHRLTDEITSLRYIKDMTVESVVTFENEYSELGQKNIGLSLRETKAYHFTWPGISLSESKLVIEPGGTDNLLATLVCADPLVESVNWSSSDENIATVDADGYIDVFKTTGEAVITATFDYLGKTYSDSCTVYVRVPVESMKMKTKKVNLSVGETTMLQTKVSPSDATVQTVTWYTEDEKIATVDADGTVHAIGQGTVTVYALSADGYYRSTCEVNVE